MNLEKPTYTTVQPEGLLPVFVSSLVFNGVTYTGDAGRNKKEAEQLAARTVILSILGNNLYMLEYEIVPDSLQDLCKISPCVRVGGLVCACKCIHVCAQVHISMSALAHLFVCTHASVCVCGVVFVLVYADSVSKHVCILHLRCTLIHPTCVHSCSSDCGCMCLCLHLIFCVYAHPVSWCACLYVCAHASSLVCAHTSCMCMHMNFLIS